MAEWNIDAAVETLRREIAAVDRRHAEALADHATLDWARHDAADKALDKAAMSMEKRLDGMNEFREQLRDQAATLLPRIEYDRAHEVLVLEVKRFSELVLAIGNRSQGRGDVVGWIVGAVGLLVAVASLIAYLAR